MPMPLLINSWSAFGRQGEEFLEYAGWVRGRVLDSGAMDYYPTLHFDLYGMAGLAFTEPQALIRFLGRVEAACAPLRANIETPVLAGDRDEQIDRMASIRADLQQADISVGLVADEWCNDLADVELFVRAQACDMVQIKMPDIGWLDETVEAVRICRAGGVAAFLGGSCTETDTSARYSVHVALATQASQLLAKPGMGVDEGLMIVGNEQSATLAVLASGRR